jgi:hypothetical protein
VDSVQVNWTALTDEFHRRDTTLVYGALASNGLVNKGCDHKGLEKAFKSPENWSKAFKLSGGAILFAYGVFAWGMEEWEYTIDHGTVTDLLENANVAMKKSVQSHEDLPAVEVVMQIANSLNDCMEIEDTQYNSCLSHFNYLTDKLVKDHGRFANDVRDLGMRSEDPVRTFLHEIVQTQIDYYTGLDYYGKTALAYRKGAVDAASHQEAISQLNYSRDKLTERGPDVLASELLPYLSTLAALRNRSLDELQQKLPNIQFEHLRFIYVYPFAIDGFFGKNIEDILAKTQPKVLGEELGDVRPTAVSQAKLTDLWKWRGFRPSSGDAGHSPLYDAVDIEMPELTVTNQDGKEVGPYRVTIRITTLGNHYVRIETDLTNEISPIKLPEINQGLRRVGNLMVEKEVTCEGIKRLDESSGPPGNHPPSSLTEYAKRVIKDFFHLFDSGTAPLSKMRLEGEILSDINVLSHVILEVRSASVVSENGHRRDATEREIKRFGQRLLLQPLTRMGVAPDEWVCYRTAKWINILDQDSFAMDFAVGTTNTTILSMPASPEWFYNSYEECIELAVSLPSLLGQWAQQVGEKHKVTSLKMDPLDNGEDQMGSKEFTDIRQKLHDTIVDIRKLRTDLTPSELVGSGHHRAFLEKLFRIVRISDLLDDLDAQLQIADFVHNRAVEHQRRLFEKERVVHDREVESQRRLFEDARKEREEERDARESRFTKTTQYLLILIGSFAFAGVAEMFDHQLFGEKYHIFEGTSHPSFNLLGWAVLWIGSLCIAFWYVWRQERGSGDPRKSGPSVGTALRSASLKLGLNRWNRPRLEAQTAERSESVDR